MMQSNENCCVYMHRNIINNKSYIGISIYGDNPNRRWQNGKGYIKQPLFYNAILKYGWDNFEHIIWDKGLSLKKALDVETMLIALFQTNNIVFGYNVSNGGESFSMDEVGIVKRTTKMIESKNYNRIQKSITMFKERFDNGDKNILQCQKCGAYFEKNKQNDVRENTATIVLHITNDLKKLSLV